MNDRDSQVLTHLDLFSGIGGFALAASMVGQIKTVAFCEREPYAQRVLKKHWPETPICDDIHKLKGNDYGSIDLVTGGFPCQPYSLAGERRGNADDRALWPQMHRVIREARPAWVIGENVPGIISLALDGVLADLEREGYACETFLVPACAVDAKHRRNRVWIVAHSNGAGSQGWNGEKLRERPGKRAARQGGASMAIADCISRRTGAGRQDGQEAVNDGETVSDANDRIDEAGRTSRDERHMENSNGAAHRLRRDWCPEPDVGRVAHGIPARVDRLRGLGNAVVPQVAAAFLSKIIAIHAACLADHPKQEFTYAE